MKFYEKGWFIALMLIFFAPAGIFLLWRYSSFGRKGKKVLSAFFAVWFVLALAVGNSQGDNKTGIVNKGITAEAADNTAKIDNQKDSTAVTSSNLIKTTSSVSGKLKVSYINVGQADSILIQQGSSSMLIDAGNNGDGKTVQNYINSQGITKLDYLVGTHPHEDHIGGMDYIINSFKIGKIYLPKAASSTATFQDVLTAIKNKGMKATSPTVGETFKLGEAQCTILGPINSNPQDLNTYSIVIKIVFGNNKFLFTGDAQASNEQDMINKGFDLSADVLKVGHHGSYTSTSQAFLNKVNPKYAVISVGKNNEYGHPNKDIMDRLKAKGIKVYRTDENGTIVCTSDGKNISFNCNPGSYNGKDSKDSSSSGTPSNNGSGSGKDSGSSNENTNVKFTAVLSDTHPTQNERIRLTVSGPGGTYIAVCRYKSKDTAYSGAVGSPLTIDISRASKGYEVVIFITITYNGHTYNTQTSFTPR